LCSAAKQAAANVNPAITVQGDIHVQSRPVQRRQRSRDQQFAHFAQLSLANLEKFAEIGLDAARDSVEQATAHSRGPRRREDVHEVIAINSPPSSR